MGARGAVIAGLACLGVSSCLPNYPCSKDKSREFLVDTALSEAELAEVLDDWYHGEGMDFDNCQQVCNKVYYRDYEGFGETEVKYCHMAFYCGGERLQYDTGIEGCPDTAETVTATVQCSGVESREGFCDY